MSTSDRSGADSGADDLFSSLPDPSHEVTRPESEPPAPGSRRARRQAAEGGAAPAEDGHDVAAAAGRPAAGADARGGLEDLFRPDQDDEARRGKKPKKRRTGCIVVLIIVLVLLGGAVAGGIWVWNTYGDKISDALGWGDPADWEDGIATGEATITINEGDTGGPVSQALFDAGVTRTPDVFYDYLIDNGLEPMFYPGIYQLQQKMTAEAALAALEDPANRMEHSVRVPEGATLAVIVPTIADSIGMPIEELDAALADPGAYGVAAPTLEGWLFPAVYTFDPEATATDVIARMVERTRESLAAAGVAPGDEQRVLTIASIIQREGHADDFGKVSRVIANRLDPSNDQTHGLLQMDSTAQYGYGLDHEGPVSEWPWSEVVGADNGWNTYVHAGLPVGPISAPNDAAIAAAAHPEDGPWFYFVTVNLDTGETVFSATYEEQQAAEAQYRQWCADNPDRGCY